MPKPTFIDLSHHNVIPGSLEPAKAAGILGVIHKLTEGSSYVDDKVKSRCYLADEAGMLWGLYHFIRPGDPRAQARFFIEEADEVSDDNTLYALDWEDADVSLQAALDFMDEVEKLTGHVPVLYSGHALKDALGGTADARLSRYRLWLAQYSSSATLPPGFDHYWAWQYTDDGSVPGVNPPTDLNDYYGGDAELYKDWSGRSTVPGPTPEPIPEPEALTIAIRVGEVKLALTIVAPAGTEIEVETHNGDPHD